MRLTPFMAISTLLLQGIAVGCATEEPVRVRDIPVAMLGPTPLVSIGVEDGNPAELLAGANSALYLQNGSIVIANTSTHDIRVFDSTGQHLLTTGRFGSAPGEFRGFLTVYLDSSEAVAVYDHGTQRVTIYDDSWHPNVSTFIDLADRESFHAGPTSLWGKFWIHGGNTQTRQDIHHTLELTELNSFHGVLPGAAGCLWTASEGPYATHWTVHSPSGEPVHRVALPPDAQLLQVADSVVLLRVVDSLGVVRIVTYSLGVARECWQAPPTRQEFAVRTRQEGSSQPPEGFVPQVMIAQEMHYMKHSRYADAGDALQLPASTPSIRILRGDERGYLVIVTDDNTLCALGIGYLTPAFWLEGIPYCG